MSILGQKNESDRGHPPSPMQRLLYRASLDGYGESFCFTERGLYSVLRSRYYRAEQVKIVRKIYLESGFPGSLTNLIYFLETSDGLKGTFCPTELPKMPGDYLQFMLQAERIQKMIQGHGLH